MNVINQKNKHPQAMDILFLNIFKCTCLENPALVKSVTEHSTLQTGSRFYVSHKPYQSSQNTDIGIDIPAVIFNNM